MSMGNMAKMMKQVQKMQEQMKKLQEELEHKTVEASSGGGAVRVVVTGKQKIVSIEISPDAVDPEDVEMLQDMVLVAVNEALQKSQDMMNDEMESITGGVNIPGLL